MQIQWYPGHMTKARRMMAQNLSLIDVVVELVDARAPYATRNPDFDDLFAGKSRAVILNKSDLANEQTTQKWAEYYRAHGWVALTCTATESGGRKKALALIERAAKDAQAYDFIKAMPQGFDTWLDQGGVNVSGGQKQRLCIARAMLRHPSILILDDSTSAVDSATEAEIRRSFSENLKDVTVIIIAQRISSVRYADKIVVLDDDHIAAEGTHDELMETSDIYREIYQSQQEGAIDNG